MLKLYETVGVKKDYPELGITTKNEGCVIDILANGKAYVVEFFDEDGETIEKSLLKDFLEEELMSKSK